VAKPDYCLAVLHGLLLCRHRLSTSPVTRSHRFFGSRVCRGGVTKPAYCLAVLHGLLLCRHRLPTSPVTRSHRLFGSRVCRGGVTKPDYCLAALHGLLLCRHRLSTSPVARPHRSCASGCGQARRPTDAKTMRHRMLTSPVTICLTVGAPKRQRTDSESSIHIQPRTWQHVPGRPRSCCCCTVRHNEKGTGYIHVEKAWWR
jgi:hypothetical protein